MATKVITKNALIKRIKRKLAHSSEQLVINRRSEMPAFMVVDDNTIGWVGEFDSDLEDLGRQIDVIGVNEGLAQDVDDKTYPCPVCGV